MQTYYDRPGDAQCTVESRACLDCENVAPIQAPIVGIVRMAAGGILVAASTIAVAATTFSTSLSVTQGIYVVAVALFAARIGLSLARTHALDRRCPFCGGRRLVPLESPAWKKRKAEGAG
jgi:hypothetical protein